MDCRRHCATGTGRWPPSSAPFAAVRDCSETAGMGTATSAGRPMPPTSCSAASWPAAGAAASGQPGCTWRWSWRRRKPAAVDHRHDRRRWATKTRRTGRRTRTTPGFHHTALPRSSLGHCANTDEDFIFDMDYVSIIVYLFMI